MLQFDFVTDPAFRGSLESDYREMAACLETGSWKAVLVLAGSTVEGILVDYIDSLPNPPPNLLEMMLGQVLTHCKQNSILSEKCFDVSTTIKNL